jgi:lysozyme
MFGVNQATRELVKSFEGLVLHAYPDPATGGDPWTIGYGHTSAAGAPHVAKGMTITADQADAILQSDLNTVLGKVQHVVTHPVSDNQLGALVSFAFNVGLGNLLKSTLLKKVNAGDFHGAANEFLKWDMAAGKHMPGLERRRIAEAKLFSTP